MDFVNWYPSWEQRSVSFNILIHFSVNMADDNTKAHYLFIASIW